MCRLPTIFCRKKLTCKGLCVAYELRRAGFEVSILEAATKVGGRVKTVREPFVEGLHAEAGAMRLPGSHFLVHGYLNKFKMSEKLESFEQKNKLIYLTDIGEMITYDTFDKWLKEKNDNVQKMFPNLQENEKGKTIDELWDIAVEPVVTLFKNTYEEESKKTPFAQAVAAAYKAVTDKYDKYTLRSYFSEVAGWSDDCIRLYDWGEPHVVLDNGFIESWKDAFLSSNSQGEEAQMKQVNRLFFSQAEKKSYLVEWQILLKLLSLKANYKKTSDMELKSTKS